MGSFIDRRIAGVTVVLFLATALLAVSNPSGVLSGQGLSESDFSVNIHDFLIHIQEMGDNDVLANVSVKLSENASGGAVLGYVACTDCTGYMSSKVVKPGEKIYLQYEYNLRNQSEPSWRGSAIDYIGLDKVPDEDIEEGTISVPANYVENESLIGKLPLDLPNQAEIGNYSVETHEGELPVK